MLVLGLGRHLGSEEMLLVGLIWVQPAPINVTSAKTMLSAKMASMAAVRRAWDIMMI